MNFGCNLYLNIIVWCLKLSITWLHLYFLINALWLRITLDFKKMENARMIVFTNLFEFFAMNCQLVLNHHVVNMLRTLKSVVLNSTTMIVLCHYVSYLYSKMLEYGK